MENQKPQTIERNINIPKGVKIQMDNLKITVEGSKGKVERKITEVGLNHKIQGDELILSTDGTRKKDKKTISTYEAHIKNMIRGVTTGHKYVLKICSGHFPMNVSVAGEELIIKNFIGEKKPRKLKIKKGVTVKVEGDKVIVENSDLQLASQTAANIEQLTRRCGFDRRKFQDGIYIIDKDGTEII